MPKIRGVKPEFWTDDAVVELSPFARLLFLGMWNFACDNGHLADKPRQIKMRILPADSVDMAELIEELTDLELVERGEGWITVTNLGRHQKVDRRYFTTCDKPGCCKPETSGETGNTRRAHGGDTAGTRRGHDVSTAGPLGDGDGDGDGDGEREAKASRLVRPASGTPDAKGHRLPDDWFPSEETRALMTTECPAIDLRAEFTKFKDYWTAQPGAKGRKTNWDATYRNWVRKAADDAPRARTTQSTQATGNQRAQQAIQAGLDLERMMSGDQAVRAIAR